MEVVNSFNAGMRGLQYAQEGLQRNAETIARSDTDGDVENAEDVNTAMVESLSFSRQAEASVRVVKAADQVTGSLIDTLA